MAVFFLESGEIVDRFAAADALALAICHIWRGSPLARLEQQAARQTAAQRRLPQVAAQ